MGMEMVKTTLLILATSASLALAQAPFEYKCNYDTTAIGNGIQCISLMHFPPTGGTRGDGACGGFTGDVPPLTISSVDNVWGENCVCIGMAGFKPACDAIIAVPYEICPKT